MIPYCNNKPKPKYTPKKQAQNNQSRSSPLIHRINKVVPGPLSAEIWAHNDQRTENQKAYQIRQKIATFTTTLAFNNPLKKKTEGYKLWRLEILNMTMAIFSTLIFIVIDYRGRQWLSYMLHMRNCLLVDYMNKCKKQTNKQSSWPLNLKEIDDFQIPTSVLSATEPFKPHLKWIRWNTINHENYDYHKNFPFNWRVII